MGFPLLHDLEGGTLDLGVQEEIDTVCDIMSLDEYDVEERCHFLVGNLILSIAQQEMGIAHVVNAFGEGLQSLVSSEDGSCALPPGTSIADFNDKLTELICFIGNYEGALAEKLDTVLQMTCDYTGFDFGTIDCDPAP